MTWVIDPQERIFRAWGSVEVRDKEGQLIPMDELKKVMPVLMRRGGFIIDSHSNRVHGKLLDYDFKDKIVNGKPKPGIIVTGKVFKDYKSDDEFWSDIKTGKAKGMSFGGKTNYQDYALMDGVPTEVLKEIEAFELSVVRGDKTPVNPEATMVSANKIAKATDGKVFVKLGSVPVCINCEKEKTAIKACDTKDVEKGEDYDSCVAQVKEKVDPLPGKTKEESAHAICTESVGKANGQPKTEEERKENHEKKYGTDELPPRGTGLKKMITKDDVLKGFQVKPSIMKMIRKAKQPVKIVIKPSILKRIHQK